MRPGDIIRHARALYLIGIVLSIEDSTVTVCWFGYSGGIGYCLLSDSMLITSILRDAL